MSEIPDRRNPLRLLVSKETQLRILWLVGGGIFFCIVATLALWGLIRDSFWTVTLMGAVGAFISLWVSRKIAGPFYRIEKDLETFLSGAAVGKTIQLRPGDPLERLATLVNQVIRRSEGQKHEN
jgi:hypothetical protein